MNKYKWQAVGYFLLFSSPFSLITGIFFGLAYHLGVLRETLITLMCLLAIPVFLLGISFLYDKIFSALIWSFNRSIELWKKDQSND